MAEVNMTLAKKTYATLLKAIEMNNWHCRKDDEKLSIEFGVNGDDLHMDFTVFIDTERQLVRLISKMPYKISSDKLAEIAIATGSANYALADGSFDFDLESGNIYYRMTTSYRASVVSPEAFMYMVNYAAWAVDKFNDKFLMISNGKLSVMDFVKECES